MEVIRVNNATEKFLLNRFGIYHGTLRRHRGVRFTNPEFFSYIGRDSQRGWMDLSELFPEVVGLERDINLVIDGKRSDYSVVSVNRDSTREIFFNLYFLDNHIADDACIIVVRDLTKELLYRQVLQQNKNEIELLQHQLIEKNDILDRTNRAMMKSRDEMRDLNLSLEKMVQERTRQLEESNKLSQRLFMQTVKSLMYALEKRDPYTAGHQQRVSNLACAIARELGLDEIVVEGVMVAGNLHDIGKIYVPSEFLTKPGKLTDEEFSVIKTHPRVGFDILKDIEFPWPVATYVLQHHEHVDGSGYPFGLEGDEINFEAKILTVADVVEAMATQRPYQNSPGLDMALEEILRYRGVKYDPVIVDACVALFASGKFQWNSGY